MTASMAPSKGVGKWARAGGRAREIGQSCQAELYHLSGCQVVDGRQRNEDDRVAPLSTRLSSADTCTSVLSELYIPPIGDGDHISFSPSDENRLPQVLCMIR